MNCFCRICLKNSANNMAQSQCNDWTFSLFYSPEKLTSACTVYVPASLPRCRTLQVSVRSIVERLETNQFWPLFIGCGMGPLQPHVNAGGAQMYQQQVQQAVSSHPTYQGHQHFSDNPHYKDSSNGGSIPCLYPNYQVRCCSFVCFTGSFKEKDVMFIVVSTAGDVATPTIWGGATAPKRGASSRPACY